MNISGQISVVFMVTIWAGAVQASPAVSRLSLAGSSRLPRPMSLEEMAMLDSYPHSVGAADSDDLAYELRNNHNRKRFDTAPVEHFSRMNRRQELTNLYGKIAKEFPFLMKQGLLSPDGRKVSIDDLLSMTVFGQPKMGKK